MDLYLDIYGHPCRILSASCYQCQAAILIRDGEAFHLRVDKDQRRFLCERCGVEPSTDPRRVT